MKDRAAMANPQLIGAIRQGQIAASQAWTILGPIIETADRSLATKVCDALRSWVWKALDRRRRDPELRQWIDLLNRVEAFFTERFANLAAKLEVLADMLHESLAVADFAVPQDLLSRRHVAAILRTLADRQGSWVERSELMRELELKPANTTRLMALLLDVGWAEQVVNGREARYRASTEGMLQARSVEIAPVTDHLRAHIGDIRWFGHEGGGDITFSGNPVTFALIEGLDRITIDHWSASELPSRIRPRLDFEETANDEDSDAERRIQPPKLQLKVAVS
ncbi:hypothetical protein [Sphingomonas panni]|uniref:hypothetical protein n=1 Tax=Sphingomonas panni TaxID=237612 RepID=UPI001F5B7739|nr:hypothetical protein [Sphingomonas panni]